MGDSGGDDARYRAFISYSHRDQAFGRRLHRRLERYGVPRRLVGRLTPRGEVPARVAPVFRDREDFSAAGDLTAEVRAALAASGALVVVCSPAAAASPWVGREVALFRELHPDRPVLAALASGAPAEAFPAILTVAGGAPVEPLAADFRPEGDGPRLALLKLVAGVIGVGLDELVQRDVQRRLRNVTAITAGAVAVAVAMSALTIAAFVARADAQRQRGEAEALVEFMLTDLRDRLKGVGRLDVLTAVNRRAADYYGEQDLAALPAGSLERRARLLHAMGEDDVSRGDFAAAARELGEAQRTTAALLAARPNDPERVFGHAQSEYWVALLNYRRKRSAPARVGFLKYRGLAAQLVSLRPDNPAYRRELGFAEGNLCSLALDKPQDPPAALTHCAAALDAMQAAAAQMPAEVAVTRDLINRHAWMADARKAAGDLDGALSQRRIEEEMLNGLMSADPQNMELKETWVALQRSYAALQVRAGHHEDARARIVRARLVLQSMIVFDPENASWLRLGRSLDSALAYINTQTH